MFHQEAKKQSQKKKWIGLSDLHSSLHSSLLSIYFGNCSLYIVFHFTVSDITLLKHVYLRAVVTNSADSTIYKNMFCYDAWCLVYLY